MDALTLDQFQVFLTVVKEGSFAAAARRLDRAQSAITYAIQKLEEQSGVCLFDRSAYRAALTDAGHALLPHARRIIDDLAAYRLQAQKFGQGLEARLSLVLDEFALTPFILNALKEFQETFPTVQVHILNGGMGATPQNFLEEDGDIAVLNAMNLLESTLEYNDCAKVELVAVVAPGHPLAGQRGPIGSEKLRDHRQILVTRKEATNDSPDFGVTAVNLWYVTNSSIKLALLLEGLGWGSMPRHVVTEHLATGRLLELSVARWGGADRMPHISYMVAYRKDKPLGPACRWLISRLSSETDDPTDA
jgi:DNA-binding transcriptional LysR family regulator